MKTLFKKLEYSFLVEHTKIEIKIERIKMGLSQRTEFYK